MRAALAAALVCPTPPSRPTVSRCAEHFLQRGHRRSCKLQDRSNGVMVSSTLAEALALMFSIPGWDLQERLLWMRCHHKLLYVFCLTCLNHLFCSSPEVVQAKIRQSVTPQPASLVRHYQLFPLSLTSVQRTPSTFQDLGPAEPKWSRCTITLIFCFKIPSIRAPETCSTNRRERLIAASIACMESSPFCGILP